MGETLPGSRTLDGSVEDATPIWERTREAFGTRWRRRAFTLPSALGGAAVAIPLLPVALVLTGLVDVIRDRRFPLSRAVLCMTVFLWAEAVGIVVAGVLWPLLGWGGGARRERFIDANHRLQAAWVLTLFAASQRILGYRVELEGDTEALARPGGVVLLSRHASTVDTLVPFVVARGSRRRMRYVLKRELLMDPCLDIVGQRIPNVFTARGSGNPEQEARRVVELAQGLETRDAVVIFPEGTRFTERKRTRLIEKFRDQQKDDLAAFAESLRYTLSPLRSGAIALLESTPGADVVVVAHQGFGAMTTLADVFSGTLIGRVVRIRVHRVSARDMDRTAAGVREFLQRTWSEIDRWIDGCARSGSQSGE